jgi:signal transduction histidine kinase
MPRETCTPGTEEALRWRRLYEEVRYRLDALVSLARKYGSSTSPEDLYREFLLTVLSQLLAQGAAYFTYEDSKGALIPTMAYGSPGLEDLETLRLPPEQIREWMDHPRPKLLDSAEHKDLVPWEGCRIAAPVVSGRRLLGVLFVGPRVNEKPYEKADLALLHILCEASSVAFNHAMLVRNTLASMEEVQRLQEMRAEMIDRVVHELRTPTTVIKAALSAIRVAPGYEDVLTWITESFGRLERLVHSLVTLVQETPPESSPPGGSIDPVAAIQRCVAEAIEEARARDIRFHLDLPSTPVPKVAMEEERIVEVLRAVLDNAVRFNRPGGLVEVVLEPRLRSPRPKEDGVRLLGWDESARQTIDRYRRMVESGTHREASDEASRRRYLVLRIRDEGVGIPPEEIERLAEPFQVASNSPDRGVRGQGLGLSVAQKLLARTGGAIYLRSRPGRGTRVTLFLPVAQD